MVNRIGMAWSTQSIIFVVILARVVNLKQNKASFLPHLTVCLCLQLTQMSIFQDLVIFMPTTTTTTTDGQTDNFTPCACARGIYKKIGKYDNSVQ